MNYIKKNKIPYKNLGINFWLYRIAFIIAGISNMVVSIAITWWIMDTYHKAIYVSYVMIPAVLITIFSNFLLSPIGDKFNRKKIIIVGIFIQIIAYLLIILFHLFNIVEFYIFILFQFLYSFGLGIVRVGSVGFVANIVKKDYILYANNIIARINSFVSIFSAIFGGVLSYKVGVYYTFIFLLTLQVLALILMASIKANLTGKVNKEEPVRWINDFLEGVKYTLANNILQNFFIYSMIIGIAFAPMQLIVVYLIKVKFSLTSFSYGIAISFMSVGVIVGSLFYNKIIQLFLFKNQFLFLSSLLFCLSFILLAIFNDLITCCASLCFIGVARNWINVTVDSKLLSCLSDEVRTRVLSNMSFFGNISLPISNLFTGFILDAGNIMVILIANAMIILLASTIFILNKKVILFVNSNDNNSSKLL